MSVDSFQTKQTISVAGTNYTLYAVSALKQAARLPFVSKILLENLLRNEDGERVTKETITRFLSLDTQQPLDIAYNPARVLMQDFTGVPAVADLAAMRDTVTAAGADANRVNPIKQTDLVIDHSVQVDSFGSADALSTNVAKEFSRNVERYKFLNWGQKAFSNFRVVPPGVGIVHQVNIEKLAPVVFTEKKDGNTYAYPDTVIGTDSHTTMVNGIGVLGWGVGGIEAESVMLGQSISMLVPSVIGFRLTGALPVGTTATDLVLIVTNIIRTHGAVGKFVEFYGPALATLSAADRATIANMAPEYGATCGLFPVDNETLAYLHMTGRDEQQVSLVEHYYRAQGMFCEDGETNADYDEHLSLDLSTIVPSLAGPKRPQDTVLLKDASATVAKEKQLLTTGQATSVTINNQTATLDNGDIVIAAITSCTNTSNPSVMMGAGLVAKKAAVLGISAKPWVKTSFGPGSQVVSEYLKQADLLEHMERIGFHVIGYGCTTCIGNSGPLIPEVSQAVSNNNLSVVSVLSGNRNFEGRVHPQVKMNFLASPPLVVAYAIAGTMNIDITKDAIATTPEGKEVYLDDIWPTDAELAEAMGTINSAQFRDTYADFLKGSEQWQAFDGKASSQYAWDADSTYIQKPPFFSTEEIPAVDVIEKACVLGVFGDSVTTDHISPAGNIAVGSPAAQYLQEHGVEQAQFNSYGSRRGNHEVMMRGTFANIRLRNAMASKEGGFTKFVPTGEEQTIYDAAMGYRDANIPVIVLAGKEYGTGSSRDWAAKGVKLLGVRVVIAQSFERIHRSNLVGMGILPLEFTNNQSVQSLGLTGEERFTVSGIANGTVKEVNVVAHKTDNTEVHFAAKVRIDTPDEVRYFQSGGILSYVLRTMM